MSTSVLGNDRVYTDIEDLPENSSMSDGDKFIVQTADGETVLLDYSSIKIDLEHTTFNTTFSQMVEFTSVAREWVQRMTTEFESMQSSFTDMRLQMTATSEEMEVHRAILEMIMGTANGKSSADIQSSLAEKLSSHGLDYYNDIMSKVGPAFSFGSNNLLRVY